MKEVILLLEGLNCASCADKIEELANKVAGVGKANLNFVSKKLTVDLENEKEDRVIGDIEDIVSNLEPDVKVIVDNGSRVKKNKKTLLLEGLDCAACAGKIEDLTRELEGVDSANLDFVSKKLRMDLLASRESIIVSDVKEIVNKLEPDVVVIDEDARSKRKESTLLLKGLDCADCASKIEKQVRDIEGVDDANLDFVSEKLKINVNPKQEGIIIAEIRRIVNKLEPDVEVIEEGSLTEEVGEDKTTRNNLIRIVSSLVLFLIPLVSKMQPPISIVFYVAAYLIVGTDIIIKAFKNLMAGQALDEYFLMTIATIGAFIVGEYAEGVMVMLLYQVGMYLQGLAVNKSRSSISALMDIRPDYANMERNGEIIKVDPEELSIGDFIVIRPGERVPLDGLVVEGESSLDTSNITGESVPRKVGVGEEIISGSVNNEGLLRVEVKKEFGDSTISKVLDLVENASSRKAPTEDFITKFARYYTPFVVGVAAIIGLLVPLVFGYSIKDWAYRAFTFLVISCPCALVISVPLGFFGGIGGASREGILIKGGNYLEALSDVDTMVFDKTGTITEGVFEVTDIDAFEGYTKDEILEIAAYGEFHSSHPIGLSIIDRYGKEIDDSRLGEYKNVAGKGLDVELDKKQVLIGNERLLVDAGIEVKEKSHIGTVAYIGMDNKHIGTVVVADKLKANIIEDIKNLKKNGIKNMVMLSGDNSETAIKVGEMVGLDKAHGDLLPQDKVELFEKIITENKTGKVAFVGDGVNDAPALARADVGIAMGGLGSDAAIEASDVVIMTDEIGKINTALNVSHKTKRIVTQNIWLALGIKLIVLVLGAMGIANMWMAVFADVGVSIIAIFNSIRALRVEK